MASWTARRSTKGCRTGPPSSRACRRRGPLRPLSPGASPVGRAALRQPVPSRTTASGARTDDSRWVMVRYGAVGEFLQATIALIAIANPVAALPVFLSLVASDDPAARRAAASRVAVAVFAILAGAVLAGRFVLGLFGISFAAFRVGGGLVVTLTGLDMLRR